MKYGSYALIAGLAACTFGFAETGTFSYFSSATTAAAAPERIYTTEQERLVSEIAGSILNIAAFAGHFEPGDPFQVRNTKGPSGVPRFELRRRAEEYTVTAGDHVWVPSNYVRLARSLMADGAGLAVSEDSARDDFDLAGALAHPTAETIQVQNVRLSRLLHAHPRSAALHERAALLVGVVAAGDAAQSSDPRPFLCRMTAHLAVARALRQGTLESDGRAAEQALLTLAQRERGIARGGGYSTVHPGDGPATFGEHPQFWIIDPDSPRQAVR